MNKFISVMLAISLLLVTACAMVKTDDIQIEADVDPKANFSGYKSYAWLGSAAILNDAEGRWEPPSFDADSEIKFLIDRELRKRGMSESSVQPDMIVAFALGVDMDALELKVDQESKIGRVENIPKGALVVVIVDSTSGYVIWMGEAMGNVQQQMTTEETKKRLDYAVTQMLSKLPR